MGKRIISQHRGRGSPRYKVPSFNYMGRVRHRAYDDKERQDKIDGIVIDLVDCRGHNAPLAMIEYEDGERIYIVAGERMYAGQIISSGINASLKEGNTLPLKKIPEGTQIYNIEKAPGDLGKFVRVAGSFAKIDTKSKDLIAIKMPSKKIKQFNPDCRATIGLVAGAGIAEKPILKAGKKYFMMKAKNKLYPRTSAGAMNATDHPFGSGRGGPTYGGKSSSIAPKNAPPGRKVGMIRARKTGRGGKN
ncbi:50S ribosomal protein L2 [Candidatus Woesearchaeota archaeon]|nr:50S ribosomal protein L2P [uncultured archaeon]MBS3157093.1 50S ribosomal protein L2 [Candidatus Woesearchaeota archaeon]